MSEQKQYDDFVHNLRTWLGATTPTPPVEGCEIGLASASSKILIGWVPKYWSVLHAIPECKIHTRRGPSTFGAEMQADGSMKAETLKLFIMQCHAKSERLTAEEYNNFGYAYAAQPEPDLEKAEWALHNALRRAKAPDVREIIQKNLRLLMDLKQSKIQGVILSTSPQATSLPQPNLQTMREVSLAIVEGNIKGVRYMTQDEVASLEKTWSS